MSSGGENLISMRLKLEFPRILFNVASELEMAKFVGWNSKLLGPSPIESESELKLPKVSITANILCLDCLRR